MIHFQYSTSVGPISFFICNVCGRTIEGANNGAVLFSRWDSGQGKIPKGQSLRPIHVHNGDCLDIAMTCTYDEEGGPWFELTDHILSVTVGTGLKLSDLIISELRQRGEITADEFDELSAKIEDLEFWLREHDIRSPLV